MDDEQDQQQQGTPIGDLASAGGKKLASNLAKKAAVESVKMGARAAGAAASLGATIAAELAWRFKEKLLIIGASLVASVVFFILFLVVIFVAVFVTVLSGGESPAEADEPPEPPIGGCSSLTSTLTDAHIQSINDNMWHYKYPETHPGEASPVPWEMLAAVHYAESGNQRDVFNPYQLYDEDGNPWTTGDFLEDTKRAADHLDGKSQFMPPWLPGYNKPEGAEDPSGPLDNQADWTEPLIEKRIKNALWGYNGHAEYQREEIRKHYTQFDPIMEGYEGSGYVMNRWDEQRESMLHYDDDGNPVNLANDGTWKVFVLLKTATYDGDGKITELNETCGPSSEEEPFGCPVSHGIVYGYLYNPPAHLGIDMSNQGNVDGNSVRATHSGKVVWVSESEHDRAGYWVEVENAIYKTRYLHLLPNIPVTVGQVVTRGEVLGTEGSTGDSSGSHLHYEVYENGGVVDPTPFIPIKNEYGAECKASI